MTMHTLLTKNRGDNSPLSSTLSVCNIGDNESAIRVEGESHAHATSVPNLRSRLARFCTTPTHLIPPGFQHKVVTMASSSAAEQDPVPSLDDQDESVRIAVKALGDMRNSRPQPSSSNSIRVYNLSHCPPWAPFPRPLTTFTRVPFFTARPRRIISDLDINGRPG